MSNTKKTRIGQKTRRLIAKRREWRIRAICAAIKFATYPTGAPDRDKAQAELCKCLMKVKYWFRPSRAAQVVNAIQRRAIDAFRKESAKATEAVA
jgi:hypothetical protein